MNNSIYYFLISICVGKIICTNNFNFTLRTKRQSNKCILPPHPAHGKWEVLGGTANPGEEVATNTVLTFSCDVQYKLSTAIPYVICNVNWDVNNMPNCEKLCSPIFSTAITTVSCRNDGQKVKCHEASDGTSLQFSCAPYYEAPLGSRKIIYCVEGEWSAPEPVCQPVCGKRVNNDVLPIIAGGTILKSVEFPWIIALYRKGNVQYSYICGGSILSRKVVLTAAHCVTDDYGNSLPAEDFQAAAAKLYSPYRDSRDPDAQYVNVDKVLVNSEYRGESRRFLGDVALLITKIMFKLSPLVQPVCFNGVADISLRAGTLGEIAAWGNWETNQISEELRFLSIPYKYDEVCEKELPSEWSEKYNVVDKMCAGLVNQSKSVCKGDSGSALAFRNYEDNRYYVHGVASLAPVTSQRKCNIQQNALYTKVAFYYEFIDRWIILYQEDNCVLPSYPKNGIYFVKNDPGKGPGDLAFSSDILRIQCSPGFTLTGNKSRVTCDDALNMPTCQLAPVTTTATTVISETSSDLPFTTPETPLTDIKVIICTFTSTTWFDKITVNDLNVNLCNHFDFSFAEVTDTGNLTVAYPYTAIDKYDWYNKLSDLKKRNPDLKMVLSVEGNDILHSTLLSGTAKSTIKTATFIDSAKRFITEYNFDGINIDWFNPDKSQKDIYANFFKSISEVFKDKGWLVIASCAANLENTACSPRQLNNYVDFVIIKTYDMREQWAIPRHTHQYTALYPSSVEDDWEKNHLNVNSELENWLNAGLRKDKLVMSVVFYGRRFKLKNAEEHGLHAPTTNASYQFPVIAYSEFCSKYNTSDWTRVWNDQQQTVYFYKEKDWISIDTKDVIKIKGAYAKKKGLLGVNVAAVDFDDVFGVCGTKWELLKHLRSGMGHLVN